jgi:hypothetical protein
MSGTTSKSTNKYIGHELAWLEEKAHDIVKYIEDNPYNEMVDRKIALVSNGRTSEKVTATIEVQHKDYRESLKDYGLLMDIIKKLKESEAVQIESRGKGEISSLAKEFLNNRK